MPDMPVPDLAPAFVLALEFGPALAIGRLGTGGERTVLPVTGGQFEGCGLAGLVIGGSETRLARRDGVTTVEAVYLVALAEGRVLRLLGTGFRVDRPDFAGMRLSIACEIGADDPHAWLAERVFIAERPTHSTVLDIAQVL